MPLLRIRQTLTFRQHTGARLDRLTPAQLRRYHLFLLEERRLAIGTVVTQICALRFFCRYVLRRRDDRNGVYWSALASGHLASFDRRKCKGPLNGPTATGPHCPEGWTLYAEPLPQFKGMTDPGSVEGSYYTWVDQFDTLGLGANVPINTGNASEALLALKDGKWVVLRVPYPLGFYTKWMDGRIDDPKGGWKGRGLWATVSTRAPFHMEGGKGTMSKVLKVQVRPDPLAR